jgi:hypothetical protein
MLADLLRDLVAADMAMCLVDRLANGIRAIFEAGFPHLAADLVMAVLVAGLIDRLADRVVAILPDRLVARLADGVLAVFPALLRDGPAALLRDGLVAGLVARLVAGLAFVAAALFGDLFHDGFLDRLVAGLPAFLEHFVVHQLVRSAALLLAWAEATLRVTAWLRAATVGGGAAVLGGCVLADPEQACQRNHKRRRQAHPHDLGLLIGTGKRVFPAGPPKKKPTVEVELDSVSWPTLHLFTLPYRPLFQPANTPSLSYGSYPPSEALGFTGPAGGADWGRWGAWERKGFAV